MNGRKVRGAAGEGAEKRRRANKRSASQAAATGTKVADRGEGALASPEGEERQAQWNDYGALADAQLALFADALPDLVSYIDAEHRYRFVNKVYEHWFGASRAGAIGKTVAEVLGPEIFGKIKEPLSRAFGGERVVFLISASVPALGTRQFEATFTPDIAPDGTVRGTVDLVRDVTDRCAFERVQEEGRRRLEATAARQEFLATISRVFAEAESNPPALVHTVAQVVARHFGDTAAIILRPPIGRGRRSGVGFTMPVFHDVDEEVARGLLDVIASNRRALEDEALEAVLRHQQGLLQEDPAPDQIPILAHQPFRSWLDKFPVATVVVAPMRLADRATGAVMCTRRRSLTGTPARGFSQEDLELLQDLADRAAISIENAQLLAELNAANAETDLLFELTDAVNRAESLDGVYAPALTAISKQLRTERCALLLADPDGVIRFKAWRGLSDEYRRVMEGHSPWERDEQNPRPVLVEDVMQAPELKRFRDLFVSEGIRAITFIPVAHGQRLLGAFAVYSEEVRSLSALEIRMAQTISDQVASAVGQKQVQAERERLIAELTQTVRLNELFAGILGHDLRNPLGAILMSATVLARKETDPTLARTAGRILTAGQRMNRMIAQLLDFTRIRAAGTLPIQPARVDIATIIRQAIDEIPDSAGRGAVRLDVTGNTEGWWDADRLAQAGANLVTNALRHGESGSEVGVTIDGTHADHVTVTVKNAGVLPPELLQVIWEPFQRGELRDRRAGLGLGLFITRQIVTAHGGTITLVSEGGATIFSLRLPRAAAT